MWGIFYTILLIWTFPAFWLFGAYLDSVMPEGMSLKRSKKPRLWGRGFKEAGFRRD